jgi:hypothetical protein
MTTPMPYGESRCLTVEEEAALSPGLLRALEDAGAAPRIVARPALGARIAGLWRGSAPIMAWYQRIFWPGALSDVSLDPRRMAVLQHELQHVLEYATGELRPLRYALNPRNWRYAYPAHPDADWRDFGAEQRAQIVEDLWLVERGLLSVATPLAWYRRIVPWA